MAVSFLRIIYSLFYLTIYFSGSLLYAAQENIPLQKPTFIENNGQMKSSIDILFYTDIGNLNTYIRRSGVSYVIQETDRLPKYDHSFALRHFKNTSSGCRIDIDFIGANNDPIIKGVDKTSSYRNYFLNGNKKINTGCYNQILCSNIYNNIDVLYAGAKDGGMKYDIIVKPQGDVNEIKLKYSGIERIDLLDGKLEIFSGGKLLKEYIPKIYQQKNGQRIEIKGRYCLKGTEISFEIENYDKENDLIIDPWVSYWGGNNTDDCSAVTADNNGNIIVTGYTASSNFPVTPGAFNSTLSSFDAFVSKFTDTGALLWSTYVGGSDDEFGRGITVDANNRIIVCGATSSANFPIIGVASQPVKSASNDVFILIIDAFGNPTLSTFFGGNDDDYPNKVIVDHGGNILFSGTTLSTNLPGTSGAYQTQNKLSSTFNYGDAFVTKMNSSCTVQWATYFGGTEDDYSTSLCVDASDNIFFTGATASIDFPTTSGATQTVFSNSQGPGNGADGFLAKLSSSGTLLYSTYWGGGSHDTGTGIVVDRNDNVIINGFTWSPGMHITAGAYQINHGGGSLDGFASKFDNNGSVLWSTFYGSGGNETSGGIAIDKYDNITFVSSTDGGLPISSCAYQPYAGGGDCFILRLDKNGDYVCSTYLGGGSYEREGKLCLYKENLYVVGYVYLGSLPTTAGAAQANYGGGLLDGYIARICNLTCGNNTLSINFSSNKTNICSGDNINYTSSVTLSCDTSEVEWNWSFPGGTPSTSTERNPQGIIYSAAGTYNVALKINSPCADDSLVQTALISVTTTPTALITGSNSICSGSSSTLSASSGGSYQWNTGSGASSILVSPMMQSVYSLTVSNGICSNNTTYTVNVTNTPTALISGSNSICSGSSATLSSVSIGTYQWNTGATTSSISPSPNAPTIYSLTVSNGSCSSNTTFTVDVTNTPVAIITGSNSVCLGSFVTLSSTSIGNYQWNTGATTSSIQVSSTTQTVYSLTVANGICNANVTFTLNVNPLPTALISGTNSLCSGNNTTLTATGGSNYLWNNGTTSSTLLISPTSGSIYSVTVSNGSCTDVSTFSLTVNLSPVLNVTGQTSICEGDSSVLSATGAATYSWNYGSTLSFITVVPTTHTSYTITGTSSSGCSAVSVTSISVMTIPVANAGVDDTICLGNSVTLNATGGTNYVWNTGVSTAIVSVTPGLTTNHREVLLIDFNKCNRIFF